MTILTFGAAAFCLITGIAAFFGRPGRLSNQAFLITTILAAAWLASIGMIIHYGELYWSHQTTITLNWLRANGAISMFLAWSVLFLNASIVAEDDKAKTTILKSLPWLVLASATSLLCFTEFYIPSSSTPAVKLYGPLYFTCRMFWFILILIILFRAFSQLSRRRGIQRVETQFVSINLSLTCIIVLALLSVGPAKDLQWIREFGVLIGAAGFGLSAWAITFHRTYNARQIFVSLAQRIGIVLLLASGVALSLRLLPERASTESVVICVAAVASLIFWLDHKSRRWLRLGGERELEKMRRRVLAIAHSESNPDALVTAFESLLRDHYRVSFAELLLERGDAFRGRHLEIDQRSLALRRLSESGWATPESLQRQRSTLESEAFRQFLVKHAIAGIVWAPRGRATPSVFVVVGQKASGWPLTYPEVEHLISIAELMDNVVLQSRLAAEAALKARVEHLAMLSRGLAHDLKNLITPVSAFLVHTDANLVPDSVEAEVHAAARRSVATMSDYIGEALFFANRLAPKFEDSAVDEILKSVVDISSSRATAKKVTIAPPRHSGARAMVDRVLIQRLLANLVSNAIDACAAGGSVTLSAESASGHLRLLVTDTGAGIAPENRTRIFEPYFTTKNLGDGARGFGLGLTICEKIVRLHGGDITIDSELGRGTTMTVQLPPFVPSAESTAATSTAAPKSVEIAAQSVAVSSRAAASAS